MRVSSHAKRGARALRAALPGASSHSASDEHGGNCVHSFIHLQYRRYHASPASALPLPFLTLPYLCHPSSSDSSELPVPLARCLPVPVPRGRYFVSEWGWVVLTPPATRWIDMIS
jgi:hypothetical protein